MLKDITIGQFYPGDSLLHRLDPRTKLIFTFVFLIAVFFVDSLAAGIFLTVCLLVIVYLSSVPLGFMFRGLKGVLFLLIFTAVFNVFFSGGDTLYNFGIIKIYRQGVINAALVIYRMVLLVVGTSLLTLTTTPNHLMEGIRVLFNPLKKFNLPVEEVALMMSIALRFIPVLASEADRIMKAQLSRGANFEEGNILKRAKAMIPVLLPLFVSAFRRAEELSVAMEARCYRSGVNRSSLYPLKYGKYDMAAFACMMIIIFGVTIL